MGLAAVKGQGHAVDVIRGALARDRLHHAYLFAGPEGVGKGMTAMLFAQALLCPTPTDSKDACGVCSTCIRVEERQHADLHVVERLEKRAGGLERQIKVAQIRDLQRTLSFKAYEGARRVVVILEADRMTPPTANALLKTLEEPGADTHFILVSDAAHRLLPTVISRCQRVRFSPLNYQVVAELVTTLSDANLDLAQTIARLAEGSVGRALTMIRDDVISIRSDLLSKLDSTERPPLSVTLDLAEDLARPDQREGLPQVFHVLRTWYRDLLVIKQAEFTEHLVNQDQTRRLMARSNELSTRDIQERLRRVNISERAIMQRMANARLVLEALFVHLTGRAAEGRS